MSIPLDRLYHYIENIAEEVYGNPVLIYRFYPHGSKNLKDLQILKFYSWYDETIIPGIYCNDQEPLDYNYYENCSLEKSDSFFDGILTTVSLSKPKNFKRGMTIYDQAFLLHSEKRSQNLKKYEKNNYIPIYYWNHALLAIDWFRYANHTDIKKSSAKKFLIYNRAWTGTREYRLKFVDLLVDYNLISECQISVAFTDQNLYYKNYNFKNINWKPTHHLEQYFDMNDTLSTSSADFVSEDYSATDIEIVLETLFDDERLHLTEKSLRPIACGQPFILAATYGSLKYLKNYGFKTFDDVFDENYDLIQDPGERLQAIVVLMKQISNWSIIEKQEKMRKLQKIADYNKKHFFSDSFFNKITNELKRNLLTAFTKFNSIKSCNQWISKWDHLLSHESIIDFLKNNKEFGPTETQIDIIYEKAKKYIK